MKDTIIDDLDGQIRHLQREITVKNHQLVPLQSTVLKSEHEKIVQQLHSTRHERDELIAQVKNFNLEKRQVQDVLMIKLDEDLTALKQIHEEQSQQQIQARALEMKQLHLEIQLLKHRCEDKENEVSLLSLQKGPRQNPSHSCSVCSAPAANS